MYEASLDEKIISISIIPWQNDGNSLRTNEINTTLWGSLKVHWFAAFLASNAIPPTPIRVQRLSFFLRQIYPDRVQRGGKGPFLENRLNFGREKCLD